MSSLSIEGVVGRTELFHVLDHQAQMGVMRISMTKNIIINWKIYFFEFSQKIN